MYGADRPEIPRNWFGEMRMSCGMPFCAVQISVTSASAFEPSLKRVAGICSLR